MPNGHVTGGLREFVGRIFRSFNRPHYGAQLTDIDGNVYKTVVIGKYTWMAENLRVTHFRDGTDIPNIKDNDKWKDCNCPALCFLNNTEDPSEQAKYGALYNYRAALFKDRPCYPELIAPEGWMLPTYYDWARLELYLMDHHYYSYYAGDPYREAIAKSLASKSDWKASDQEATPGYDPHSNNTSLFNALPAPGRSRIDGSFGSAGYSTEWWRWGGYDTAYPGMGCFVGINYQFAEVIHHRTGIDQGLSVRLIKDWR